jgi:subtilisin family serine protease
MKRLGALLTLAFVILAAGAGRQAIFVSNDDRADVVVALGALPLARAPEGAAELDAEQNAFRSALERRLPEAHIRWRYRLVANGFAVSLPARGGARLRDLPGVRDVYASAQYRPRLDQSPAQIGAPALWGQGLDTAGQGIKIGIIDSGVDQEHVFFDPSGYSMPTGFPKGQRAYTTAKVIAARAFPPPGATQSSSLAFAPDDSSHGTHVAGIAAGNARTRAGGGRVVSGVAPRAYIGNYKVFVATPSGFSPNANSPEIVAAIEAAVSDGMDVINFSGGELEIEPSRDIVARALDAAAAAGVVPIVAAGNEYDNTGAGSVLSPGNSARAITVGAVESSGTPLTSVHAEFSSVGPTPISLRLKPDVVAPGIDILSSVPRGWSSISGTSMAAPHIAGAAALLRERHPDWTVANIKSALVQSAGAAFLDDDSPELAGPSFVGGGMVSLQAADQPLLFAAPSSLSFGLLRPGSQARGSVQLGDAGGGAGTWQVTLSGMTAPTGATVALPSAVVVPGALTYEVNAAPSAGQGELSGYITLRNGVAERHVPFWARVSSAALAGQRPLALSGKDRVRSGTTQGRPALVTHYRYPEDPSGLGVNTLLAGPELVYRIRIDRRIANLGVVVTSRSPSTRVEPRIVSGLDENRLTGVTALPLIANPYLELYGARILVAGALSPRPGEYSVVFDSPTKSGAGRFTFRYWVNDVTPPTARLRSRAVPLATPVVISVSDAGAGVFPQSILATIDGRRIDVSYRRGVVRIPTRGLALGTHRLRFRVSDYQETRNTENVARILPNTRVLTATVTIHER